MSPYILSLGDLEALSTTSVSFDGDQSVLYEDCNCDRDCGGDCFQDSCNPGECESWGLGAGIPCLPPNFYPHKRRLI